MQPGTPVEGTHPTTSRRVAGWLRGPHPQHKSNGLWIVDNPKWDGDSEHLPGEQWLVRDIRPLEGRELEDTVYKDYAKKVLDGALPKDDAVRALARDLKIGGAKVAPRLDAAIAEEKAERRKHAPASRAPKAAKAPAAKGEHAPPTMFAELRDGLGMTNKEAAAASEAAGLGSTLSRMTELTHSKGASAAMYERVKAAWVQWRAEHPLPEASAGEEEE